MPLNGYSTGRDITLNINTGAGILRVAGITAFRRKQETTELKIRRLDAVIDHVRFFDGWTGSFTVERRDPTLDRYFNQLEADAYAGITEAETTISETISEQNGAVSQYRYRKVLLKFDDAGEWRGDSNVKMNLAFLATRRMTIA
jgi:hypothetical protein